MRTPRLPLIIAVILCVIALARIIATYTVFSNTDDEPFHIASGMEWLDKGNYTYEAQHPPLSRVAVALGPYLDGLHSHMLDSGWEEGKAILYDRGTYWRNLTLARLGTLPFFIFACVVVFLWARRWFSETAALWSLAVFVHFPVVLSAAGQATTDMACAATLMFALYHGLLWLEDPSRRRAVMLGVALGLAMLSKFSIIPFLAACGGIALLGLGVAEGRRAFQNIRGRFLSLGVALVVAFVLTWAGYRFSFHPFAQEDGYEKTYTRIAESNPRMGQLFAQISAIPIPMPELPHGVFMVVRHNQAGHDSFFMGEYRDHGWWNFFPVLLGIKTPLGLLLLTLAGLGLFLWRLRRGSWQQAVTVCSPLVILAICMRSNLNLGVRHILPIYPFMAVVAGGAAAWAFHSSRKQILAPVVVLLAGWGMVDSWRAHPDYLGYFNALAGSHPEEITVEADLGQDIHRLSQKLQDLGAKEVAINVAGTIRLEEEGLPPMRELPRYEKVTGYVAISDRARKTWYAQSKSFAWLRAYTPIARVGQSISVYYIPE